MKAQTIFLAASAVVGALAVPLQERDVVMYTVTQDVVDIVSITSTVWVDPQEYTTSAVVESVTSTAAAVAYTPAASYHRHGHAHSHSKVAASSSVAPVDTPSSTSAPAAVTPTTTSVPETPSSTPTPTPSTSTTPTSTYVAPTTSSTSVYTPPAPTTSSTSSTPIAIPTTLIPVVSTSAYVAPAAATTSSTSSSSGSSYGGGDHTGQATYYEPGLGSCGDTNDSSELIVAISHTLMDAAGGSNGNPLCGKQIKATASDTGKSVTVTVEDRCVGCSEGDLDFTSTGFEALGHALGDGRFDISWSYV